MAYYKVRIEVWCDWNPAESDLDYIVQSMGLVKRFVPCARSLPS
jgi:hypothetical protein